MSFRALDIAYQFEECVRIKTLASFERRAHTLSVCGGVRALWRGRRVRGRQAGSLLRMHRPSHIPRTAAKRPRPPARRPPPPKAVYRPTALPAETIGNHTAWSQFRGWLGAVRNNDSIGHIAILTGPAGTGKTHGVHLLAKERGFAVFEMGPCEASADPRSVVADLRDAGQAALSISSDGIPGNRGRPLVLLDDVDAYPDDVVAAICAYLAHREPGAAPIVCTCSGNTALFRKLQPTAQLICHLRPLTEEAMVRYQLARRTNRLSEKTLWRLAQLAQGDLRQFLLRARLVSINAVPGRVDASAVNIFQLTESLLSHRSLDMSPGAPLVLAQREDAILMIEMVFENYVRAVPSVEQASLAAEAYSVSELMHHPHNFRLLPEAQLLAFGCVRSCSVRDVAFAESRRRLRSAPQSGTPLVTSWKNERGVRG